MFVGEGRYDCWVGGRVYVEVFREWVLGYRVIFFFLVDGLFLGVGVVGGLEEVVVVVFS